VILESFRVAASVVRGGPPGALAGDSPRKGLLRRLVGPVSGGALSWWAVLETGHEAESAALVSVAFACGAFISPLGAHWERFLPLMGRLLPAAGLVAGVPLLLATQLTTGLPGLTALEVVAVSLLVALVSASPAPLFGRRWRSAPPLRAAVIGPARPARLLARELDVAEITRYVLVGRVASAPEQRDSAALDPNVPTLGELDELRSLIEEHELDLLVTAGEEERRRVLDEVVSSCMDLPVRLMQFSNFYEHVFGHVPTAEMSSVWFEHMLHPRYRREAPASKRLVDVVVSTVLGVLVALPLVLLAFIIRRDGGPALFRQTRVGEGGRPFTLFKLRTMRPNAGSTAQWASSEDPRVTRIGRFLRRTHLDELPQLLNVIRGDMSLVGPRPEQPEFVHRLEEIVPFYSRRHLIKPGITGWAQVLCGYAGSEVGSAWKLSHDLYYLKHRSLIFDLVILGETVRKLFVDPNVSCEPRSMSFIVPAAPERPAAAEAI
jgi:exopolysaccharide biosynthesis polyprenyl glycosylphosphotransferase